MPLKKPSLMTAIEKAIGQTFKKQKLLISALTHPSSPDTESAGGLQFQRLEFLGDSIINSFIALEMYRIFPGANEGTLSRLRSILVSRKILAEIATKLRLKKYLRLGYHEQKHLDLLQEKIIADAYEALVAAIYLDLGRKKVEQFLTKCFKPYLNQKKLIQFGSHPKNILQEYSQKKSGGLPKYESQFDAAKKLFQASASLNKRVKAKGMGRTKQEAESAAATALIRKLKIK